ncbi:aryl-sulfate sulfotransferase [Winogradskyella sp.]|uniref:aryl-sulfate sulfotransferase n=1 Tax=Winogradskyella sp. TaxID=1883156 RepID=UPI0025E9316B|nr:aryl-sulfate sulfotransferase [Winogradskyella sp.]
MKTIKCIIYTLIIIVIYCCDNDDEGSQKIMIAPTLTDNVEVYNGNLIENGYVFAVKNGGTESFLLDKAGNKVKEWTFDKNLGNDLELLSDGRLLGIFKAENPDILFGGYGGIVQLIDNEGNIEWEYTNADNNQISHHDTELLPNGNVLIIIWERITAIEAQAIGMNTDVDIFTEKIIEVNPATNQIAWQWRSIEHTIQDNDNTASNFGSISNNPKRIDINYNLPQNGDIMHANGIDYDPDDDVIFLSVNKYSEIWVIDHSTSSAQASTGVGGNYNKGGDLIYRFGNPETYMNNFGERLFNSNHFPNFLQNNEPGSGNILVYENGIDVDISTVYELEMPQNYNLIPNTDNEPNIIWSFTDPTMYHGRISGAVRLDNGNTLITEGDFGFWEVTNSGEVVWKYNGMGDIYWRSYGYINSDQEIIDLNL